MLGVIAKFRNITVTSFLVNMISKYIITAAYFNILLYLKTGPDRKNELAQNARDWTEICSVRFSVQIDPWSIMLRPIYICVYALSNHISLIRKLLYHIKRLAGIYVYNYDYVICC